MKTWFKNAISEYKELRRESRIIEEEKYELERRTSSFSDDEAAIKQLILATKVCAYEKQRNSFYNRYAVIGVVVYMVITGVLIALF